MTLKKDDLVELVEKDDNGWWLVKKDGVEGWAPSNYLELVPPKPKAAPAPPPPPPPPANRRMPPIPTSQSTIPAAPPAPKVAIKSVIANANAKPVSVFPGLGAQNASATPWKKSVAAESNDSSPANSRPVSSLGNKPPPPVAAKPKPAPPVGAKPVLKTPGKPPVPSVPRPISGAPAPGPRPGGGVKPSGSAPGQLDLAAVVSALLLIIVSFH